MPSYDFKAAEEFGWAIVTAAGLAAVQLLNSAEPGQLQDPLFWKITIGGAALRAIAGAVIDFAKSYKPAPSVTPDDIRAIVAEELAKQQAPHIAVP